LLTRNPASKKDLAKKVLIELGGAKEAQKVFPDVSLASIYFWRSRGIPIDKERYLRAKFPELQAWKDFPINFEP
jgi:hypothetical protein